MDTKQYATKKKIQWVNNKNEIKEEILKYHCHFKKNDNENTTMKKSMGSSKNNSKRKLYSNTRLSQEMKKTQIQQNLTRKRTIKRRSNKRLE